MPELCGIYQKKIEVKENDIDVNRHVNNISYVKWMQEIAMEHSAALGWPGDRYFQFNVVWVVRRHTIDYRHQAWLHDTILAETWVSEMKRVSSVRKYRFTRMSDGALLAEAETLWGFISTETGHPVRILPEVDNVFRKIQIDDAPKYQPPEIS